MSYRDHIDFGIVADRQMIDDAWPLMERLKVACNELQEEVCGKKRRAAAPASEVPADVPSPAQRG